MQVAVPKPFTQVPKHIRFEFAYAAQGLDQRKYCKRQRNMFFPMFFLQYKTPLNRLQMEHYAEYKA